MTGSGATSAALTPMSALGKSRHRPAFRTSLLYPQQQIFHIRTFREHAVQPIPRQSWILLDPLCTDKRTPPDLITKSEKCPQADASSNSDVRRPVAKSAIVGLMRVDQRNRTGRSAEMVDFLKAVNWCGNAFHSCLQLEGQKLRVVA